MVKPEMMVMLIGFAGVLVAGVIILVIVARATGLAGKRIDHRKEFFRLVEAAREAEILEKKPVAYDVSGTWKGESDGYFGIGRFLEIDINQNQSDLTGRITDQFGFSEIRGFFVWPYLWFDLERHGTIFEFRGVIKESPDGATIAGRYRYFQDDADWTVTRPGGSKVHAPLAVSSDSSDPSKNTFSETPTGSRIFAPVPPADPEAEDPVDPVDPFDPATLVPTEGPSGATAQRAKGGKCPDCGAALEEILSFCIYCGKKRDL